MRSERRARRRARRGTLRRKLLVLTSALLLPIVALALTAALTPLPAELRAPAAASFDPSTRYVDRSGRLLREVRAEDTATATWVRGADVDPRLLSAVLAAEDRRFYDHVGVDPWAVGRAAVTSLWHRRVVSGASTLTMQLARLVRPHRRTVVGKFLEMALALRIEASLPKARILEEYINRAPFGQNVRGVAAASRALFQKDPRELSWAEAATLAAIPRGPSLYVATRRPELVKRRRDRILGRMLASKTIDAEDAARAVAEPLDARIAAPSFGAPHLVDALRRRKLPGVAPGADTVETTLDLDLQREAERACRVAVEGLAAKGGTAASVLVVDNRSGEVLSYVGSPDALDAANGGANDGVLAHRQPGSTLKPFVYAVGMERLGLTTASLLPDVELALRVPSGVYSPRNYDEHFHGPVRLREALANSYNVPAVWVANEAGPAAVLDRLHAFGFASLGETPDFYGPAIALGDGEVSLLELVQAYAALARDGEALPLRFVRKVIRADGAMPASPEVTTAPLRVVRRDVARALTDVLADGAARLASFGERNVLDLPFPVAAKTGTSKGFRDNWTVGFTRAVTVGVWVGNFDGSPMRGVSGVSGAGPLFRTVMQSAMQGREAAPLGIATDDADFTRAAVCPLSGARAGHACPHAVVEPIFARASLRECAAHVDLRVDTRNGLLAPAACDPAFVRTQTFERFPPEYAAWANDARRPLPPDGFSPLCPPPGPHDHASVPVIGGRPRIVYPPEGTRFLLEPDRPRASQQIPVRIDAPEPSAATLVVDGHALPARALLWTPSPGRHTLVVEAAGVRSEPVEVTVE